MSDSDETVCDGSPSERNNIELIEENSPSILTNWEHVERSVVTSIDEVDNMVMVAKSKKENLLDNNRSTSLETDNNDSSQCALSPEFPLLPSELKRKDNVEDNDFCSTASPPKISKPNSPKLQGYEIQETEASMRKLDELILGMEEQRTSVDSSNLDHVKSKLAIVQKALSEGNKRNQAERKKVTSGQQSSQPFSEENKQAIFDLARKQKHLLDVFKTYKNLVQRLKLLKQPEINIEQHKITTPAEVSFTKGNKILQRSIVSQSSTNPTTMAFRSSVSIAPNLSPQTTGNTQSPVVLLVAKQPVTSITNTSTINHTTINSSNSQAKASFVLGDMAGLKHVQNSSKIKQHVQTISHAKQPCKIVSSVESSLSQTGTATGVRHLPQTTLQTAKVNHYKTVNAAGTTNLKKSIAYIDLSAKSAEPRRQEGRQSSTALRGSTVTGQRVATNTSSASTEQPNKTLRQLSTPQERRELGCGATQCKILNSTGSSRLSQASNFNSQTKQITSRAPETRQAVLLNPLIPTMIEQCTSRTPLTMDNSQLTQSTNLSSQSTKPSSGISLSLETLMKEGVLASGKNVLTTRSEGKLYSASLSGKGTIVSAGGEGFTSPRSWIKAIVGSKRKVKNEIAWEMVFYKEKPLLDYATTAAASKSRNQTEKQTSHGTKQWYITNGRESLRPNLINSEAALKKLLWNCRVTPVTKEELMSTEEMLGKDFWEK